MTDEHSRRSPGYFLRMLRDQAVLIGAVTVLFAGAGFAYSVNQTKQYEARASLLVQDPSTALTGTPSTGLTPAQLASAEASRVTRPEVVANVQAALAMRLTAGQLRSAITTLLDPSTDLVIVTASADSPSLAARLANAFAQQDANVSSSQARGAFAAQASAMRSQLKKLVGTSASVDVARLDLLQRISDIEGLANAAQPVQVEASATAPGSPSSPLTVRNTLVLAVLGLLAGIGLADVRRSRDRRVLDPQQLERDLGLPLIGHISGHALGHGAGRTEANGKDELHAADLEGFRILRQNVEFLNLDTGIRSIVVTSALAEEGKSTVASLLAHANAAAGKLTLLIECDLRRPVLAERLGLSSSPGLSDYLAGTAKPMDILQLVTHNPLSDSPNGFSTENGRQQVKNRLLCVTAGSLPRPPELLGTERFRTLLMQVTEAYDTVVLDAGPLLPVVDTLELVSLVDGVVVCVRAEKTTRDQVERAINALAKAPKRPVGLVVTGVTPRSDPYYTYYQSYSRTGAPTLGSAGEG